MKLKKYPLLICLIISFVIIISSALVVSLCGVNVGSSLGGGSQMEIIVANDANASDYVPKVKGILSNNKVGLETCFVEDKIIAGEENATFTSQVLVVKLVNSNVSDETELKIRQEISNNLHIDIDDISEITDIYSAVKINNLVKVGIAVTLIAVCAFAFGFIRYNIFAGLSFLVAILHNLLIYFSLIIVTRVQLSLASIAIALLITLFMLVAMIRIFERHRELTNMHLADKLKESERLLVAEKEVISPYLIIATAILVGVALLLITTVPAVIFIAVNMLVALTVSAYTLLFVGPGVYAYFLDMKNYHETAILSRNNEVNKHIKKKTTKASKKTK